MFVQPYGSDKMKMGILLWDSYPNVGSNESFSALFALSYQSKQNDLIDFVRAFYRINGKWLT